ncbi:MAG: hypothetical protein M1818_004466 [Claussenomyces sp. TS43310]|nr:MAG: hypothetical protein M1818_004466 [Claussenomyces sp. TS43310]
MPVAKKRKVTTTTTKNASSSKSITAFTRVSKARTTSKFIHEKATCAITSVPTELVDEVGSDRKRKSVLVEEIEVDPEVDADVSNILSTAINPSQRLLKPLPQRRSTDSQKIPQTPQKPKSNEATSVPADTPTKGARSLLDRLRLSTSSSVEPASSLLRSENSSIETSSITDLESSQSCADGERRSKHSKGELPAELLDLINLNSAFLTALSLHYAHNGTHTPADLRLLCPDVARAWGKRRVLLDDIRRTLGVLNSGAGEYIGKNQRGPAELSLSDYGHGKICVENKVGSSRASKIARPLDENHLNDAFARNLTNLWESQSMKAPSLTAFMSHLPMAPITTCSSLTKMSPLLAKGQRRLEDMRAGLAQRKDEALQAKSAPAPTSPTGDRKLSLLERLRAKQLHQSTLPAPPSKLELDRRAALHRVDEVVSVLGLLSTSTSLGQQRISFTLPTVLGRLKDSFRTPISRDEGEVCLRLLAGEIAPEWLRLVKMGKTDAIVIDRDARPCDLDIQERVRRAL